MHLKGSSPFVEFFKKIRGNFPAQTDSIMQRRVYFYRAACRRYILELAFPESDFPGSEDLLKRTKILSSYAFEISTGKFYVYTTRLHILHGEYLMKFPKYENAVLHFRVDFEQFEYLGTQVQKIYDER